MNRVLRILFPAITLLPLLANAQSGKPAVTRAGSAKALTNMNFDKPDSVLVNLPKGSFITFVSYVRLNKDKNLKQTLDEGFDRDSKLRVNYYYNLEDFLVKGKLDPHKPGPKTRYSGFAPFNEIPDPNIQQVNDTTWQVNFKYHPTYDAQRARRKVTYYDSVRNKQKLARYRMEKEADYLLPYSRYIMILGVSSTGSMDIFTYLHDYFKNPFLNWYDLLKAAAEHKKMLTQQRAVLGKLDFLSPLEDCISFFHSQLQPLYISIDQHNADIKTQVTNAQPAIAALRNNGGLFLLNTALREQQTANLANTGITRDSLVFLYNLVSRLNEGDARYFEKVLAGDLALNDQSTLKPASGWPDKTSNLQATLVAFNKLHTFIDEYAITRLHPAAAPTPDMLNQLQLLKDNLTRVETAVRSNLENCVKISAAKGSIEGALQKNTGLSNVSLNYASSFVQDLQTRGALSLTPDFGVISYGFTAGNQKFWGVTPYLGVQINIRPFDKNISFSSLPKSYRKWYLPIRWSAMLGITFVSVKEAGKRDNLFSGTNLLLGVGYKLTSEVRLTAGAMLFKKYDLNYVSSDTRLAATPYAGVSIDLDLKKFFSSITDVFIGK